MNLLLSAFRNLAYWQPRNIGSMMGIMIAIASLVALVGLARGVQETLLKALQTRGTDVLITETGALDLISSIVPEELAVEIAATAGVIAVAPELTRLISLQDGRSVVVSAWPHDSFPWRNMSLVEGRLPLQTDTHVVVLGNGLAQRMRASVGDTIALFQEPFEVIGIVVADSLLTRNLAYAKLQDVQSLTFREGQATSFNIRTEPEKTEEAIETLRAKFPDYSVENADALTENYLFGRIANILAFAISAVALISSTLVIFNTMSTAVNARRSEIAILSAIGWPRTRILGLLVIEGVSISILSGVVGIFAGLGLAHGVAALPQVVGFIAPVIDVSLLLNALLVSVGVGLLGSFLPAIHAVRQSPASVLRGR